MTKHHWSTIPDVMSPKFPDIVWKDWEPDSCPLNLKMTSWVDTKALTKLAERHNFPRMDWVRRTVTTLENGARTGVVGAGRLPLKKVSNSPSLASLPVQVLDQLRTWTRKGLLCGPILPKDLPPGAKHAPMAAVEKPNLDARLINNQSFPHYVDPDKWGTEPVSFNAGIDPKLYPTKQITSKHILVRLRKVGAGSVMCKVDWSDA